MKPTIKIVKPPPPPNRVQLEINENQATNLARLFDAGISMEVLQRLNLSPILAELDKIGLNTSKQNFKTITTF